MCGITGVFNPKKQVNIAQFYQSHLTIKHRGPDDEGFVALVNNSAVSFKGDDSIPSCDNQDHINTLQSSALVLGHRRLSIIDLSKDGHQPFTYKNLSLVYNGEIYNYKELRKELEDIGYSFKTNTDTEAFLIAYHHYGNDCFKKFVGMWAAAIYDSKTNSLKLCRDYFGIKPLYYSESKKGICFGSEIKFLTAFDPDLKQPDHKTIYDFVVHGLKEHTKNTFYKNIKQLLPGSVLTISKEKKELKKLFIQRNTRLLDLDVFKNVSKSIDYHLIADVPVGISLSGGVDSTIVASYMASKKVKFQSFSSVFPNHKQFDESKYVLDTTIKYSDYITQNLIETTMEDSWNSIEETLNCLDEPYSGIGMFQPFSVYKKASENGMKVLLGGQGADEIFGGYRAQKKEYYKELIRKGRLLSILKLYQQQKISKNLIKSVLLENKLIRKVTKHKENPDRKGYFNKQLVETEYDPRTWYFNYGLREYLFYEDRLSMWHSVEGRVPFLNTTLYRLYAGLPYSKITRNGEQKVLLKEAFKTIIPESVYSRKDKLGYVSPQEIWLKSKKMEIKNFLLDCLFYKDKLEPEEIESFNYNKLWRHYIVARWFEQIN